MATSTAEPVSFADTDSRYDDMHSTIETWIEELSELVDEAQASEEFQAWLDVQSRFHDYSYRNTLLIKQQCPEATQVAGYRTWQEDFDRYVIEGESAIWIWAPIIAKRCPVCENSPSYHEKSDCEYDETPPEEWSKGLVGFRPVSVFDVSQTEGEPLTELDTAANGDGEELVSALLDVADELELDVQVVESEDWSYGEAMGVCKHRSPMSMQPVVKVQARPNDADLATTLIHEYAHARLHFDLDDRDERAKREVEAEAVAYVVGRHFWLDTSNSAFYLAAWQDEESDAIQGRLERISGVAREFIEIIENASDYTKVHE